MADVNTVVIVSDKQELVSQISQKLVLLRNLDKIKSCSFEEAFSLFDSYNPNVLIIHAENNSKKVVSLIKQLKTQEIYKNLPILLINDNCSREFVIEAFDSGISDILFMPIIDYELLIRVIWCLQKNELNMNIESRMNFLAELGIIQSENGIYAQKYCEDFLKNEISQTKKYSQRACILLISPDKKYPNCKSSKEFIDVIKKSIRLNDSIIYKNDTEFYIYLQKTKLNGAYSVFERINSGLGIDAGINAGVVEIQNQRFEDIIDALDSALIKANENTNSLIVASDFYAQKPEPTLVVDNTEQNPNDNYYYSDEENYETEDSQSQQGAFDKNSVKLFNQAYSRKIKVVIEPVFKKYEAMLRTKKQEYNINSYTGTKSLFNISVNNVNATFSLEYDGIEHVVIRLALVDNGQKRIFETETVDFTILNYRQISMMLSELLNKFAAIVD